MNTLIKTIIIDDEPGCIDRLHKDLEAFPEIRVVETVSSAERAKEVVIRHQPDLLFLDVEMPGSNGIEILQEIQAFASPSMCVVFYSAHNQYIINALRLSAFDFLLKPYQQEELETIINRIGEKRKNTIPNLSEAIRQLLVKDKKLGIQTISGLKFIRPQEVLYFQYSDQSHLWEMILTCNARHKLKKNTTADDILSISTSFLQARQDIILNIEYLSFLENKTLRCMFYPPFTQLDICLSRKYYKQIREALEIL